MMDFVDFLVEQSIQEAIRPRETNFGLNHPDFNDSGWKNTKWLSFPLKSTIFDGGDRWVTVDISEGNNLIFRTYPKTSAIQSDDDILSSARWDKQKGFNSHADLVRILQSVMFVGLSRLKHESSFQFRGQRGQAKLYKRLVDSKAFKEEIFNLGFEMEELKYEGDDFRVQFKRKVE